MRTAYKLARRFGGKIVTAGRSKHPKIVGLDAAGKQIKMTIPSSPSDNARTAKNVEAQLRRAGFIDRSKAAKVKDTLVKNTNVTAIPSRRTANQQTTFKDFTQKYQPNVQGPKRSELQVQADHILRTTKKKRKMITKAQLDSMQISDKEKQKLIRQGLVNMGESVLPTTGAGKEKAVQRGLEKLDKKYTKMYNDVNSVPKDRGKA